MTEQLREETSTRVRREHSGRVDGHQCAGTAGKSCNAMLFQPGITHCMHCLRLLKQAERAA